MLSTATRQKNVVYQKPSGEGKQIQCAEGQKCLSHAERAWRKQNTWYNLKPVDRDMCVCTIMLPFEVSTETQQVLRHHELCNIRSIFVWILGGRGWGWVGEGCIEAFVLLGCSAALRSDWCPVSRDSVVVLLSRVELTFLNPWRWDTVLLRNIGHPVTQRHVTGEWRPRFF
jgi:hypothetical protein